MFPLQNDPRNRNNRKKPRPGNILNEENDAGGIGNEALAQDIAGGLIDLISNESNNEALGKKVPAEIAGDGLAH